MNSKALLLTLLCVPALWAAGPTILANGVGDLSHSTAQFWWITDVPSTANKIKFGPTTAYGSTSAPIPDNSRNHAWWVSDQKAGSTIHYTLCSTASGTETCTADQTVTFAPDREHPVIPELPRSVPTADPGSITGTTFAVAADCSNLQSQVNAALASDGNLTHWVKIQPDSTRGAECYIPGQITVGPKSGKNASGSGYVIIGVDPATLPPAGVRVDRTYQTSGNLATLLAGLLNTYSFTPNCAKGVNYQGFGSLWWNTAASGWALSRCNSSTVSWVPVTPTASGTTVPGTCTEGSWFDKTNAANHQDRPWHCTSVDGVLKYRNRHVQAFSAVGDDAVFRFSAGSHHVVLRGLRIGHLPVPQTYVAEMIADGVNSYGNQVGSYYSSVVSIDRYGSTAHDLIFDRNIVEGWGFPTRSWNAFGYFDGANISIVNNVMTGFTAWQGLVGAQVASYGGGITVLDGPGPYRIENNEIEAVGTAGLFIGDDNSGITAPAPHDFTIRRNLFRKPDWANGCDASTDGHFYWQRHNFECKSCQRVLIEGNWFDGGWRGLNTGAHLAFSVRPGALHGLTINNGSITSGIYPFWVKAGDTIVIFGASIPSHNGAFTVATVSSDLHTLTVTGGLTGSSTGGQLFVSPYVQTVSDIIARYNLFTNAQQVISSNANNDNYQTVAVASGKRWLVEHNVAVGIGQKAGWGLGVPCATVNTSPYWQSSFNVEELGGEDHTTRHNTMIGRRGNSDYLGTVCAYSDFAGSTEKLEGYYCNDNIQTVTDGAAANGFWYDGAAEGDNALARTTSRGSLLNNVIMRPDGNLPNYGKTNRAVKSNAAVGWMRNITKLTDLNDVLQLRLSNTSSLRPRASSDGLDPGADVDSVAAMLGVVDNVRSHDYTASSAIVSFLAPDKTGCPGDYSTSPTFQTWTRVPSADGARIQDVTLTGLQSNTTYHFRVNCAVRQPVGTFRTP